MQTYLVRCQSASGRTEDVRVRARSESAATRAALATLDRADGFRAVWALEV